MDKSQISKGSSLDPRVSEDGTFCESFNDTVSRLEHSSSVHELQASKEQNQDLKSTSSAHTDAYWEQKSEFVDPNCDVSTVKTSESAIPMESPEKKPEATEQAENTILQNTADSVTMDETAGGLPNASGDKFAYNSHNESIFDDFRYFPSLKAEQDSVVKFDANDPESISHATLKALIVQLTSPEVIDYNLICDFFLTYRTFSDANVVLNLLLTRLFWSLQYLNSRKAETERLGKLVLLRTFVVLRHWILNYFFDDFESDDRLCDLFAFHINQITGESGLVSSDMAFESKIFSDLKTHWVTQINVFFNRTFDPKAQGTILATPLPMSPEYFDVKRLTKSNTEASLHTNPSFRRSAMLSLYDQKMHHKCLIHDGSPSPSGESVQLPISNLVNQHKSSRMSLDDKMKEFSTKGNRNMALKAPRIREPLAPKHNHMNLKDSSLALKKTTNTLERASNTENKNTNALGEKQVPVSEKTDILEDSTDESAKKTLKRMPDDLKTGFSTNGQVRLPSSRISTFAPVSPVKKMRCSVKEEIKPPPTNDVDDFGRKKSLKRIVEGWTKSLYSPDMRSDKSTFSQDHAILSGPENAEEADFHSAALEKREIGNRVDVLSARIIDELEFVIRYYILDAPQTIDEAEGHDEINNTAIRYSPSKAANKAAGDAVPTSSSKHNLRESQATTNKDMSLHDMSELNIEKIDNLFSQSSIEDHSEDHSENYSADHLEESDLLNSPTRNSQARVLSRGSRGSKRSSFGGRIRSINWNDEGNLILENSASMGASMGDTSARPETRFFDVSTDADQMGPVDTGAHTPSTRSSGFNSSDVDNYDAEVSDLGIAMSPQSLKRNPVQRISLHGQFSAGTLGKEVPSLSRNSSDSVFRRESVKSYMSYDSAFSAPSELSRNERFASHLKKKDGCHDLRKLAMDGNPHYSAFSRLSASSNVSGSGSRVNRASMASHLSKSSSFKRTNRLSTLCALTELPFNSVRDSYASMSTRALFQDDSGKVSDHSTSSVFSSLAGKDQRITRSSRDEKLRGSSPSATVPGLSNNILRELASIPDESFSSKNPVQCALFKLEGIPKSSGSSKNKGSTDPSQGQKDAPMPVLGRDSLERQKHRTQLVVLETENEIEKTVMAEDDVIPSQDPQVQDPESESPGRESGSQESDIFSVRAGVDTVKEEERQRSIIGNDSRRIVNPEQAENMAQTSISTSSKHEYEMLQDTQDILDAINNAVTEDAIGYSSDIEDELRRKPVTPIKTRSKSTLLVSQSASNVNALYSAIPHSESGSPYALLNPKLVLDGYRLASESLAVKQVMAAGSHVSYVLSYDSKAIAEHFTIIERDMLEEIDWKELIELQWNKDLTPVNSWLEIIVNDEYYNTNKGVNLVIARFNLVVNWIISEILLTRNEDERREIVSRFIHVAYHSYEMQNFSTLMQVVLALTSEKVNKLKSTWNNLSPGDILTLKHLEQVTSPTKNFINMRVSTNQIKPSKGCIPFVGLYLSDLVFNAERPKFVKTKKEPVKPTVAATNESTCELSLTQGDSTMGSTPGADSEKMINFSRFRTSVHIVKSLSQSIEWSQNYDVAVDDELLRKCLYIKSLDEGEMNFCIDQLNTARDE